MRRLPCSSNNNYTGRTIWPWACRELRSFPRDRSPSLQAGPEGSSQLAQPPGKSGAKQGAHCDLEELGRPLPQAAHPGIYLECKSPAREGNANPRAAVRGRSTGLRRTLAQEVSTAAGSRHVTSRHHRCRGLGRLLAAH